MVMSSRDGTMPVGHLVRVIQTAYAPMIYAATYSVPSEAIEAVQKRRCIPSEKYEYAGELDRDIAKRRNYAPNEVYEFSQP